MIQTPSCLDEFEREISATPDEFARGLRNAFASAVRGGPLRFQVHGDAACMQIELMPGPDRVIALLRLPTLTARIRFTSGTHQARQAMLRRMDLAMQRGGG
jgi:hypothetical protein